MKKFILLFVVASLMAACVHQQTAPVLVTCHIETRAAGHWDWFVRCSDGVVCYETKTKGQFSCTNGMTCSVADDAQVCALR